ncbi:MAG: DUF11 domain-containing protein [Verrucomicrobiaceae bacterium]|nr:MAG: DUF11 domain-containing protein [Verrucomicrobiaceae bacterium]
MSLSFATHSIPRRAQSGLPGTIVVYPHTFIAGSAGSVIFTTANVPSPANPDCQRVLIRGTNGNSQIDAGEPQFTGSIALAAGGRLNILVKEFIPVSAALGAKDAVTISAVFTYSAAAPALSSTATRSDVTTVGTPTTSGLVLVKSVNQATALPGQTLTCTLSFKNNSSEPLSNVVIFDATPAFSTFTSATTGPVPASLGQVSLTAPSAGSAGQIRWNFTGTLAPGETGAVSFVITFDQ